MLTKGVDPSILTDREVSLLKTFVPSKFQFLLAHKGLRLNSLHGFIGTMGCGKTSLLQSLIAETAENHKCLVWLSEEDPVEYQVGIERVNRSLLVRQNILYLQESSLPEELVRTHDDLFETFRNQVLESDARYIFIDNATTSLFYSDDVGPKGQAKTARFFKNIKKELGICIVYLAHTAKEISDNMHRLLSPEDIRGSAQLPIVSEYFYTMQKFTKESKTYVIIRLLKFRFHEVKDKFYILGYDKGKYAFDAVVPFETINKIFSSRDRLGEKGGRK